MKKMMIIALLLPAILFAQNRYTVSNAPGVSANYHSLQGAHDSVPSGSILYLLPSSYGYGDVVFKKTLTVYGTGYFLGQNLEPNTQAITSPVIVNSIKFRAGSDNSFIEGLQFSSQPNVASINRVTLDTVNNITVSRCWVLSPSAGAYSGNHSFFYINGSNNCTVKDCYIESINGYTVPPVVWYDHSNSAYPNFSGIKFINNIFDWAYLGSNGFRVGGDAYGGFQTNGTHDVIITHNTIICDIKHSQFGNLNYSNNLFINSEIADSLIAGNSIYMGGTNLYNVTNTVGLFPAIGNNYEHANADSIFVNVLPGYHSKDQKWTPRDTSFVNTYGSGGTGVGAYSGPDPYKLSGIPNLPYMYNLTVPSQATSPGTISVHIKAKASN